MQSDEQSRRDRAVAESTARADETATAPPEAKGGLPAPRVEAAAGPTTRLEPHKEASVSEAEGAAARDQPLDSYRLFRVRFDPELRCQVRELLGEYPEEAQAVTQLARLRATGAAGAEQATYEIARHAPPAYWFFQQRQLRHSARPSKTAPARRPKRKPE
jgi:hypothetical protein